MTAPYPELAMAGIAALRDFYGDGRKMVVRRCLECGWNAGFYFDDGQVRYDPGCWCTPATATRASDEGWIALLIMRSPAWLKRRLDDGRLWEERKATQKSSWGPLKVEERQRRREKVRRQRMNSELQADLFQMG